MAVVQWLSCVRLFVTPTDCSIPGLPLFHYLPEFAQTHVHWVDDAIQLSHPLSPHPPPVLSLSQHQGLFQWVSCLHQVVKVLDFSISPSSEYSRLRIDWFDLLAVQRTLRSCLRHHNLKALILQRSAFFMVHPVYDYWKNHSFACMVFVGFKLASFWSHPMHLLLAFFWNHFKSKLVYSVWILAKV